MDEEEEEKAKDEQNIEDDEKVSISELLMLEYSFNYCKPLFLLFPKDNRVLEELFQSWLFHFPCLGLKLSMTKTVLSLL